MNIAATRLNQQRLSSTKFRLPRDVVHWLGAVQAQDYNGAKWALGQRLSSATDDDIEAAFTNGAILRTHVMRPTWHFVAPEDIRWLLQLTAPRVQAVCSHYYRRLGLDASLLKQTSRVFSRVLKDGKQLTRSELGAAVERAGIDPGNSIRFGFILVNSELNGLICSGPRRGKQFTYALLEERVPPSPKLTRDEALAELSHRYFTSHGPATLQDFVWWSGLTTVDARQGVELNKGRLSKEEFGARTLWCGTKGKVKSPPSRVAYLLPTYDEYLIGYKDRSDALDSKLSQKQVADKIAFDAPVVIGGLVVASWKRILKNNALLIGVKPFGRLSKEDQHAIAEAGGRLGEFLGLRVTVRLE